MGKSVVIPTNILKIQFKSFYGSSLEEIVFENGSQVKSIGRIAFAGTKIKNISIPKSVQKIQSNLFYEIPFHTSPLKIVFFEAGSQLKTIGQEAFKGTQITTINIPADVEVGERAFEETPCADNTIFQPRKNIVDCKTIHVGGKPRKT